jgi:hypothetical protein
MRRRAEEHLSDLQIAMLVSGSGSRPQRQLLSEHLVACETCRQLLAQSAAASRADSQTPDARGGQANVEPDSALLNELLDKMSDTHPHTVDSPAPRRVVVLVLVEPPADEAGFALAAQPALTRPPALPTLKSPDDSVLVHFRPPAPGMPIRAYIVNKACGDSPRWRLFLGTRGLSFQADAEGEADLLGVTPEELVAVAPHIVLHDYEDDSASRP